MRVFLTGATGFVGQELLAQLLAADLKVRCLVRRTSLGRLKPHPNLEEVEGDVTYDDGVAGRLAGCEAVINLVGIIREFPRKGITFERLHYEASRRLMDEARRAGAKRFVQMSALGTREGAKSNYHKTKYRAEVYLKESGLDYTIFRPALIFGPQDKSINMMADMIRLSPLLPVLGDGKNLMQPVALENVAQGFVKAVTNPKARGRLYEVGGPEKMSYEKMLETIAEVLGLHRIKLYQPIFLVKPMVILLECFRWFPLTQDQLLMLQEDNVCDERPFYQELEIEPIFFKPGLSRYLRPKA